MDVLQGIAPAVPAYSIGTVPIKGQLALAPMDGYSDSPFRCITRGLGSAFSVSEFINTIEVVANRNKKYEKRCQFEALERPYAIQLFDDDPDRLVQGARVLHERWQPNWIDVNMGCSVNHVANRGAGAGLLQEPRKIAEIIARLTAALPVPVTAKIRLGWDAEHINYLEIGKIIQDNGGAMVALHARTKEQLFSGSADWDAIAALKQSLSIPVLGNGDVETVADAQRMLAHTGCDGVMIGRTAIANPWIFAGYDLDTVPRDLFTQTAIEQLERLKAFYGEVRGCVVFRKFAKKYLTFLGHERLPIRWLLTSNDPYEFTRNFIKMLNEDA